MTGVCTGFSAKPSSVDLQLTTSDEQFTDSNDKSHPGVNNGRNLTPWQRRCRAGVSFQVPSTERGSFTNHSITVTGTDTLAVST